VHVVRDLGCCGGKRQLTDFWSSVEPADQVRCDIVFRDVRCGTKVTQFEHGLLFIHLDRSNDKPDIGRDEG